MPTKLYGGSLTDFADSMAQEIEEALDDVRQEAGLEPLSGDPQDRRILFIAIARGVITHLQKKEQAFEITYEDDGTERTTYPDIKVK